MTALETKITNTLLPNDVLRKLFVVRQSLGAGGKAGKGNNVTTSFSLFSETLITGSGYFQCTIGDPVSFDNAIERAKKWLRKTCHRDGIVYEL